MGRLVDFFFGSSLIKFFSIFLSVWGGRMYVGILKLIFLYARLVSCEISFCTGAWFGF